ncbi:MAG: thioredoxin [Acidobacteriota bacterium]
MPGPISVCPSCGAKNRLGTPPAGQVPRCGRCHEPLPWLVDADEASFGREISAPVPVLVDFWAAWCGPCRMVAPVLDELSRDLAGSVKVVKVDVDKNPGLASRFDARSIPTLLVLRDGRMVERQVGAAPKATLRRLVEKHMAA